MLSHQAQATFGVWLNVARGLLGDAALDLLAAAASKPLWLPLSLELPLSRPVALGGIISCGEQAHCGQPDGAGAAGTSDPPGLWRRIITTGLQG